MDRLVLYTLVLGKVVEVLDLKVVQFAFLIEDHLEVETLNFITIVLLLSVVSISIIEFYGLIMLRRDLYFV